jgi:hypothetical protein
MDSAAVQHPPTGRSPQLHHEKYKKAMHFDETYNNNNNNNNNNN